MKYPIIEKLIRDVPDFPKPGIIFKDITPVLQDAEAFSLAIDELYDQIAPLRPDAIVGIESRGFIFAAPLALRLHRPFIPARKVGKLPAETIREDYDLEYGTNVVEMHADAFPTRSKVVIVDDLLATGGTAAATGRLVERLGGIVQSFAFLIELDFLKGRQMLEGRPVITLVNIS